MRHSINLLALISFAALTYAAQTPDEKPLFHYQEVMIPMRDGIHLQTAILTPLDQKAALPILLSRTPYGIPAKPPPRFRRLLKELMADGYILRPSESARPIQIGRRLQAFVQVNLTDPKEVQRNHRRL